MWLYIYLILKYLFYAFLKNLFWDSPYLLPKSFNDKLKSYTLWSSSWPSPRRPLSPCKNLGFIILYLLFIYPAYTISYILENYAYASNIVVFRLCIYLLVTMLREQVFHYGSLAKSVHQKSLLPGKRQTIRSITEWDECI